MKSILLVDDEKMVARSMLFLLQRSGYQVVTAGSKQEVVTLLEKQQFDLVLLDLKLSGDNGLDLLPLLCENCPDTKVVILTAHVTLESALEAFKHGVRDYLIKPLEPATLLQRVRVILEDEAGSESQNKIDQDFAEFIQALRNEQRSQGDSES